MLRFLRVFGPLAIVVGAIEIIDGIWGLIAEGRLRELRPAVSGTLLLLAGLYMIREARARTARSDGVAAEQPNGRL